jgi:MYXO-CTERM domain-containing protein
MVRRTVALVVLALGLALRGYVAFVLEPTATVDSEKRYEPLARNLAAGNGFSKSLTPPYVPNGFDQPGYPLFLAAFGGSRRAVVVAQVLLELVTVLLVARSARLAPLGRAGADAAVGIALLAPMLPILASHIWTETLATTLATASAWAWLAAVRDGRRRFYLAAGAASGAGLLVRADLAPAVALVGLAGACLSWRRPGRIALAAAAGAALLGMWTVRNQITLGHPSPLGAATGQVSDPYVEWLGTWAVRQQDETMAWHNRERAVFSPDEIGDREDCARAQAALGEPDADRVFAELTAKARRERPFRTFVEVPLRRLANVWVHVSVDFGGTATSLVWPAVLALALVGMITGIRRRRDATLLFSAVVVGRSFLPLTIGIACESRYVAEALPACYLLAGLGVEAWLGRD